MIRRLLDLVAIMSDARDLRVHAGEERPPYSTDAIVRANFGEVLVTGADLGRDALESVHTGPSGITIFYNNTFNMPAHRIGIAHGLGHVVYDLVGRLPLLREDRTCAAGYEAQANAPERAAQEIRADLFAGELLCPLLDLDAFFGDVDNLYSRRADDKRAMSDQIDRAASLFKVPPGFVRWRLFDLNHLRKTHFNPTI